ncbi:fumarylacetoacetate hydrolase family protein [Arcanobacterium urinimassiliense]|uniref:fumarylacetoacetate hydrolase family protein n=1 Tax=Arcanobacterium urinimassiliense TaxID=1871014 RepID=UPI0009400CCC|nr:fumarylacetoacetate hydrolase family protein [Arcanobacterium urinimassiliense]
MKIVRISLPQGPRFALINPQTGRYEVLVGDPLYTSPQLSGESFTLDEVQVLAPMLPRSKVLCWQGNYAENLLAFSAAAEAEAETSAAAEIPAAAAVDMSGALTELQAYIKPNTAVSGQNTPITIPSYATSLAVAPQLGVIISRPCKKLSAVGAAEVIYGLTLLQSAYIPDIAGKSGAAAYAFDTSCPLGPIIETEVQDASITLTRSFQEHKEEAELLLRRVDIQKLVAAASHIATFLPGDIIGLGNLLPPCELQAGDELQISASGLGSLRNPVISE